MDYLSDLEGTDKEYKLYIEGKISTREYLEYLIRELSSKEFQRELED